MKGLAIIIMGVTGSGKSTIGELLAKDLHCNFIDADDFHCSENKGKMQKGIPLTDEDRIPWLETLRDVIIDYIIKGEIVIVACSALQQKYREILRTADPEYESDLCNTFLTKKTNAISLSTSGVRIPSETSLFTRVVFLCLHASAELVASRLETRAKAGTHFMSPTLLQSQIDLLQIDDAEGVFVIDANMSPELIIEKIHIKLSDANLIASGSYDLSFHGRQ